MMLEPLISFDAIDGDALNRCLIDWNHKMGPLHRPRYGIFGGSYGLRHNGQLVAVVAHEKMIAAETCGLTREQAFELARVCAARPGLCRIALRLWREFVFPPASHVGGFQWAISYQDRVQHKGDLYRHDGWVRLGHTRSGTDKRGREGTRHGRAKTVWGWSSDPEAMARAREREQEGQSPALCLSHTPGKAKEGRHPHQEEAQ